MARPPDSPRGRALLPDLRRGPRSRGPSRADAPARGRPGLLRVRARRDRLSRAGRPGAPLLEDVGRAGEPTRIRAPGGRTRRGDVGIALEPGPVFEPREAARDLVGRLALLLGEDPNRAGLDPQGFARGR